MPEIVVIDPSNVTIDGVPAGSVLDIPANHENVDGIRSLVLNALLVWRDECDRCHGEHCKSLQETHAAEIEEAQQALTDQQIAAIDAIEAVKADRESQINALKAEHQSAIAAKDATIADLQSQINALGGTELAQKLRREAACQAAHDQIAAAQAILDAHS